MRCVQYREALSAHLDGEPAPASVGAAEEHMRACRACAGWYEEVVRVTRLARVAPAEPVPDLSGPVLTAVAAAGGPARPAGRRTTAALRIALGAVALGQAAVGWPAIALGTDTMDAPMHVAHESGAWNVALAVAFLAVARRPRSAGGLLPLLAALVTVLTLVTLPDVAGGRVPAGRLATHLLLVAGLVLVAVIARLSGRSQTPPLGRERSTPAAGARDRGETEDSYRGVVA